MKLFKVEYSGLWLGGVAIVFACNAEQAEDRVRRDKGTTNFITVQTEELTQSGVVYNDNGDY
jgi:hypothetical protein